MEPLTFDPYFRPQIWGGRRLERYLGRALPGEGTFGEAWVLSAQSLHVSRVAEGPRAGTSLADLWANSADAMLGPGRRVAGPCPLLLKYLDCQELLSIQVHPSDELAARLRPGELGKTEAWYILEADPTARIYAGLAAGVTPDDLRRHLAAGTLEQCLHSFVPQKGQCVFLQAGTVHAVGGGVLMAEVQQSSDVTFRLYDWNRAGPDGKPRTLHTDEAMASIDWSAGPVAPSLGKAIPGLPASVRGERLAECPYFSIDRFQLAAPLDVPYPGQLSLWMVVEGAAELVSPATGYCRTCRQGETVLLPAAAPDLRWRPLAGATPLLLGVLVP